MNKYKDLIQSPIVTEKSSDIRKDDLKYVFKVAIKTNKIEIKQAIEALFKVKVATVNTLNVKPKTKRVGRYKGMTNRYKKAIITLKEGHKIDI